MSGLNLFARLTKVDEEKRLVFGRAVQQVPDQSGEIFDYATSRPYFEQWSNSINEAAKAASGTENLGNVRAMHGKVAAGKLVEVNYDDAEKAIDVGAYIADDNEWKKVLDGVYTGFSIGGRYAKKWNVIEDGKSLKAYTAIPAELSLVDRPCIQTCTFFEVRKADGSTAQVEFAPVTEDDEEDAFKLMVNNFEWPGVDVSKPLPEVGKHLTVTKDDEKYEIVVTKIEDGVVHAAPVVDGIVEPEVAGTEADVLKLQAIMEEHKLTVADVVDMTLAKVAERTEEKEAAEDEKETPAEETKETSEDEAKEEAEAEKILAKLVKFGARNSASDLKHIQAIHDAVVSLGAACAKEETAEKLAAPPLDDKLQKAFDELTKRVDELSKAATAPKVALRVVSVSKDQDAATSTGAGGADISPVYDAFGKLDPAATAMKMVHAMGGTAIIPGKL